MIILLSFKATDDIIKLLARDGIEYREKIFQSDTGIETLGPNPFVSWLKKFGAKQIRFTIY